MEFQHPFQPVSSESPALPDKLLDRVGRLLDQNCSKIDVEKKTGKTSWAQVNVITPGRDASGNLTDDGYSIAVALYLAAEYDAEETGYETEAYRGKFHIEDDQGKPVRRVASFKVSQDERGAVAAGNDEVDELTVLQAVLSEFRGLLQIQNTHIENQNSRILQMSQDAQATTKPLLDIIETLVSHYHTGLNMKANALETIYDMERASATERLREQRNSKLLEMLMLAAPQALSQFAAFAGNQVGGGQAPAAALPTAHAASIAKARAATAPAATVVQQPQPGPTIVAGGAPAPAPTILSQAAQPGMSSIQQGGVQTEEQTRAQLAAALERAPMMTIAHTFRESMDSMQWLSVNEVLTKKQMSALKAACTGDDESSTAEGVRELKDTIMSNPAKLQALSEVLDESQVKMVMQLVQLLGQHDLNATE